MAALVLKTVSSQALAEAAAKDPNCVKTDNKHENAVVAGVTTASQAIFANGSTAAAKEVHSGAAGGLQIIATPPNAATGGTAAAAAAAAPVLNPNALSQVEKKEVAALIDDSAKTLSYVIVRSIDKVRWRQYQLSLGSQIAQHVIKPALIKAVTNMSPEELVKVKKVSHDKRVELKLLAALFKCQEFIPLTMDLLEDRVTDRQKSMYFQLHIIPAANKLLGQIKEIYPKALTDDAFWSVEEDLAGNPVNAKCYKAYKW